MKKVGIRKVAKRVPELHSHAILHRIYAARGIGSSGELEYELNRLLPYQSLTGISAAVTCLTQAIVKNQHVLVVGDFDVDGATSTTLAFLALKAMGLTQVSYLIPSRFATGYGLTPELVKIAARQEAQVIVTVDNGITSIAGVELANELGMQVVITDHHLPGEQLPQAVAIVNPNQRGDQFASKNLAGVGVIFYLMLALRSHLRSIGWFKATSAASSRSIAEPNMAQFLDLVALGTVADVVSLDYNNRILVAQGLERIRVGRCRLGIKELLAVTNRSYTNVLASDLSFVVAPRLNAVGRLDDMSLGVECLLTEDPTRAWKLARQLDSLNRERRAIEKEMCSHALRLLDNLQLEQKKLPSGICIFEETWHQGVLGILAARLKEQLHRPVIVFTAIDEFEIKGSARSIKGVDMRNLLNRIAMQNPGLITRYGGHAMAAGISMARSSYEEFAHHFAVEVTRHLTPTLLEEVIYTDGELPGEYFNLATAELLRRAGPWGQDFAEPLFLGEFFLVDQRLVGGAHLKLTLRHPQTQQELAAICFNVDPNMWPNFRCGRAQLIYRLDINEYNGGRKLQLIVEEMLHYE